MSRFQIFSNFDAKNNTNFFPIIVLHRVLLARYGNHPEGHWVVIYATINQVPFFLAHAWSQIVVFYFISTFGDTKVYPLS